MPLLKNSICFVALFFIVSSCSEDPVFYPAYNSMPNSQPKLFGYYASAMEGVGAGNYIAEMNGHANLVFIQSGDIRQKLKLAESQNLKAIVSLTGFLFDSSYKLHNHWKDSLDAVFASTDSFMQTIAAYYVLDEPYWTGARKGVSYSAMYTALQTVGLYLKQHHPETPIAVIFSAPEANGGVPIPESFDWFGVDCYTGFEKCEGGSIPLLYDKIDQQLRQMDAADGKRRQLMAIPPAGYDLKVVDGEKGSVKQINQYRSWLKYRTDIHIVLGFIWQTFNDGQANWKGTRDSKQLLDGYTKLYVDFMNGNL
jgi:hypothetical protein